MNDAQGQLIAPISVQPIAALRSAVAALALALLSLAGGGCGRPAPADAAPSPAASAAPSAPWTANHSTLEPVGYTEGFDYFPEKLSLKAATAFTVSYHGYYKVVTVTRPWRGADTPFTYLLVQRGCPVPGGFPEAQVVQVPVARIATVTNSVLPALDMLGAGDRWIGHARLEWVTTEGLLPRVKSGAVAEIGGGNGLDLEALLAAQPDLVLANAIGEAQSDVHPRLRRAGLTVAIDADYMEETPLGRAEWLGFVALFLNREAAAARQYASIETGYRAAKERAAAATTQPTVLIGAPFQGTWYVPGGRSFLAGLLADAGGRYIWADDTSTGSLPLDFETVYAKASTADYWLNPGTWRSLSEAHAADSRFAAFTAIQRATVYNNTAKMTPSGGNDYWAGAYARPDLLLGDLVHVLHPPSPTATEPVPALVWYEQLH